MKWHSTKFNQDGVKYFRNMGDQEVVFFKHGGIKMYLLILGLGFAD